MSMKGFASCLQMMYRQQAATCATERPRVKPSDTARRYSLRVCVCVRVCVYV
jgi:hypothetical protein